MLPTGEQYEIVSGGHRAVVTEVGATLRSYTVAGRHVVRGFEADEVVHKGRGQQLLPWPNRIRDGRWSWGGDDLQLELAGPDKPTAMHGLVGWQPWGVLESSDDAVTVGTVVEARSGYPFRLAAAVDHTLEPGRLTVTMRVRNAGAEPAPFGAGFHPYLAVGAQEDGGIAGAELELPARTELVVDDGGLPTGERRPFDGAIGRIGDRGLDTPVTDLDRDADGWARVRLRSAALGTLELAVDGSWPWLQVFTGDTLRPGQRRRSVAVEPMTCPPNALADHVDLVVLEPGADWSGTWTLSWEG